MFTIAAGIILAVIILANADTIVALVAIAILVVVAALLVTGTIVFAPALSYGAAGLGLGYLFVRGLRKLDRDRRYLVLPSGGILDRPGLSAAQYGFGSILCALLLGVPAVVLLVFAIAPYLP